MYNSNIVYNSPTDHPLSYVYSLQLTWCIPETNHPLHLQFYLSYYDIVVRYLINKGLALEVTLPAKCPCTGVDSMVRKEAAL